MSGKSSSEDLKRICLICGCHTNQTINIYEPRSGPNIIELIQAKFKFQVSFLPASFRENKSNIECPWSLVWWKIDRNNKDKKGWWVTFSTLGWKEEWLTVQGLDRKTFLRIVGFGGMLTVRLKGPWFVTMALCCRSFVFVVFFFTVFEDRCIFAKS